MKKEMKIRNNFLTVGGCFFALLLFAGVGHAGEEGYRPGIVLVELSKGVTPVGENLVGIPALDAILQSYEVRSITRTLQYCPFQSFNWWTLSFSETVSVKEIIGKIRAIEGIENAQPSFIVASNKECPISWQEIA
jgi:hypothetical protein